MVGGIGTVVDNAAIPSSLWSATLRHGYVGCMRDLIVNGNAVDLAAFARQQDSGKYGEHLNERQQRNEVRCKSPSYRVSSMQSSLKETLRLLRSIELVQVQLALVFFLFVCHFPCVLIRIVVAGGKSIAGPDADWENETTTTLRFSSAND